MVEIGDRIITTDDFRQVLYGGKKIGISDQAKARVTKSYSFLQSFHQNKIIYG